MGSKERRQAIWLRYQSAKAAARCQRCGLADPTTIDFHHPKPEFKRGTISKMVAQGYAWATIARELAETIPLCASCHRIIEEEKRLQGG